MSFHLKNISRPVIPKSVDDSANDCVGISAIDDTPTNELGRTLFIVPNPCANSDCPTARLGIPHFHALGGGFIQRFGSRANAGKKRERGVE